MPRNKQDSFKEKEPSQEEKAGVDGEPSCHRNQSQAHTHHKPETPGCQTTDGTELSVDEAGETRVIINKVNAKRRLRAMGTQKAKCLGSPGCPCYTEHLQCLG